MPLQRRVAADGGMDSAELVRKIPGRVERANCSGGFSGYAARISVGTQLVSLLDFRQHLFEQVTAETVRHCVVLNAAHPLAGSRRDHHVDHGWNQLLMHK